MLTSSSSLSVNNGGSVEFEEIVDTSSVIFCDTPDTPDTTVLLTLDVDIDDVLDKLFVVELLDNEPVDVLFVGGGFDDGMRQMVKYNQAKL